MRFLDKQKEQSQYDKSTALLTQDNKTLWKSLTKKTFSLLSFFGITFEQDAVSIKKTDSKQNNELTIKDIKLWERLLVLT